MRGRVPVVVGGTGFYLNTLLSSEATAPASTVEDKHYVQQLIANKTWDQRYGILSVRQYNKLYRGRFSNELIMHAKLNSISPIALYIKDCLYFKPPLN